MRTILFLLLAAVINPVGVVWVASWLFHKYALMDHAWLGFPSFVTAAAVAVLSIPMCATLIEEAADRPK